MKRNEIGTATVSIRNRRKKSDKGMIRREIEITEVQSNILRQMSNRLGLSEDELARRALDAFIEKETDVANDEERKRKAKELVQSMRKAAKGHRLPEEFRRKYEQHGRSVLYDDRLQRNG